MNPTRIPNAARPLVLVALATVLGLLLSACGGAQPQGSAPSPSTEGSAAGGAITVLAAASLTEAFCQIGKDFEAKNPGSKVTFSFGSSATLATQIVQGAPADVFAAMPAGARTAQAGSVRNPTAGRALCLRGRTVASHAGDLYVLAFAVRRPIRLSTSSRHRWSRP